MALEIGGFPWYWFHPRRNMIELSALIKIPWICFPNAWNSSPKCENESHNGHPKPTKVTRWLVHITFKYPQWLKVTIHLWVRVMEIHHPKKVTFARRSASKHPPIIVNMLNPKNGGFWVYRSVSPSFKGAFSGSILGCLRKLVNG